MKITTLLICLLLSTAIVQAYAGVGYNQEYWFAGKRLGNGMDRFGYGSYTGLLRYGGGAYAWQTSYVRGSPYYIPPRNCYGKYHVQ